MALSKDGFILLGMCLVHFLEKEIISLMIKIFEHISD